jgi:quercetin dioxygenase-like cupin family protein
MLPAMVRLAIGLVTGAALLQPSVMVEHEPMHRVVFENRLVRVIDAAVAPGQATAYHTHERDNVPVAVAPGTIAATERGGRPVESAVPLGAVSYAVGGYTHEVRNIGPTPVRFIDVELVGPRGFNTAAGCEGRYHATEIDNHRVVVHRVVLPAGARLDEHRHNGPLLEVIVRGGRVARRLLAVEPVAAGATAWREEGRVPQIVNAGSAVLEIVEVEWKP